MFRFFIQILVFILLIELPVYIVGRLIGLEHTPAWVTSLIVASVVYLGWLIVKDRNRPE